MNTEFVKKIPVIPLVLLWLAYALLGWYLAVHDIIWLAGAFIATVALAVVRKSNSWLENLVAFGSKTLIVVLSLSASIALIASWSLLLSLFLIPIATTFLADLEMRFAGFDKKDSFRVLTLLAGSGLIVGEIVDLLLFPSNRFYF
ncbi:hypothetical protein IQ259_01670 [Fortiea sp. LEGE XX443]|uniref:hypothetical protein n=1 Tax=Fortiea sp. LEGE XX443 TaxID=1828611 RepID=UPI001880F8C3|nr:hypothetical protein [Fortiea sp. LEGE XX443]MBE9003769.1 hypothetical protein [Fortiea sp. LEGE XX443]